METARWSTYTQDHLPDGLDGGEGTKEPAGVGAVLRAACGIGHVRLHLQDTQRETVHGREDTRAEAAERCKGDEQARARGRGDDRDKGVRYTFDKEGRSQEDKVKIHFLRNLTERRLRLLVRRRSRRVLANRGMGRY